MSYLKYIIQYYRRNKRKHLIKYKNRNILFMHYMFEWPTITQFKSIFLTIHSMREIVLLRIFRMLVLTISIFFPHHLSLACQLDKHFICSENINFITFAMWKEKENRNRNGFFCFFSVSFRFQYVMFLFNNRKL